MRRVEYLERGAGGGGGGDIVTEYITGQSGHPVPH